MNSVVLIGRLTKDPEVRYGATNQMAIANFNLAIDRPVKQNGEKQTDFPRIIVFGKQAENVEKYVVKGMLVGIQGRIQTGSYDKNGTTVYTTDVIADRVEFLEWRDKNGDNGQPMQQNMGYGYQQSQEGMYHQGQMQGMSPQQQMNYRQQPMQAPVQQNVQQTMFAQNQQQPAQQQMMHNQSAPAQSMTRQNVSAQQAPIPEEMPDDFAAIDEDVPF